MEIIMIKFLRILLIVFYAFAGMYHFINPKFYYPLIPDYLLFPKLINLVSGLLEIVLAICIAVPKTRLLAAKGIIILLILFIPSHIFFITEGGCMFSSLCVPTYIAWIRLLVIHPMLILWAWSIRKSNGL
ncbi:hypothetical protein ACFQ1Q_13855 [Winogradskyella litorisediminis]|uniref:DoxX family protein n=1 Tax=Winogradskyella litorisediminis TaxID=1156618 RepID=A0ABW3NAH8_9FLAO